MKTYNSTIYTVPMVVVLGCLIFIGCDKLDTDYKKYLDGKEIIYPGSPNHIMTYPGYNRAQFNWTPSPDPSISRYVIYWNNDTDSAVFEVPEGTQSEFSSVVVDNLNEGTHFFSLYSYDDANNKSIPKEISNVRVYGEYYVAGLINRVVIDSRVDESGAVIATFAEAEATNIFTEVEYTSTATTKTTVTLLPSEDVVTINDWLEGTSVVYRSAYKPTPTAIDSFYTQSQDTLLIKKNVAGQYLKNYIQPFLAVQTEGRFRDPVDWTVNTMVQNQLNDRGGWGSDENTVLVMESGWGNPDIVNGKLYQTITLPAGTYSVELELGGYGYGSSPVMLAAVLGTTLPDYDTDGQIPGALASGDLAQRTITFTLPEEQEITIGFLATMTGNQYWRVKKIDLLKHYY